MKRWLRTSAIFCLVCIGTASLVSAQVTAASPFDDSHPESHVVTDTPTIPTADNSSPASETSIRLGPALPEEIKLTGSLFSPNALTAWAADHKVRFFGWGNGGYTGSSTGSGLLEIAPRANRFGNEWQLNQFALVLERTLNEETWSWGFRTEFYMGADAAMLHPRDGLGPSGNSNFSTDFRQAYFSFHLPVLTSGGIDLKLGRQYTQLGYESTMAPYRPMYSEGYAWNYSQNGATTGAILTIHVASRLDVSVGVTLGVNSLFNFCGRAPSYIVRGAYWTDSSKRTKLVGTFYTGPQPIAAASGHIGRWQTEVEAQVDHDVNRRLTIVSETNLGWDTRDPGNQLRTSKWVGTYGMAILHAHRLLDVNARAEWFDDVNASRTAKRANYGEITIGINFMPTRSVNFRPEVRWDGADARVFGPASVANPQNHQWTYAADVLLKF